MDRLDCQSMSGSDLESTRCASPSSSLKTSHDRHRSVMATSWRSRSLRATADAPSASTVGGQGMHRGRRLISSGGAIAAIATTLSVGTVAAAGPRDGRPCLRQQQQQRPEHDRRVRPPCRRLADPDRRVAVRRRRRRHRRSVRLRRRPPAQHGRSLPARHRSGLEPDLRPSDQAERWAPARRRRRIPWHEPGEHRRARQPRLRGQRRCRRQQLHRVPPQRRADTSATSADRPSTCPTTHSPATS